MPESMDCRSCRQRITPANAYHPHLYCVLYKAGIRDQAKYLAESGWQRIPDAPGPIVVEWGDAEIRAFIVNATANGYTFDAAWDLLVSNVPEAEEFRPKGPPVASH